MRLDAEVTYWPPFSLEHAGQICYYAGCQDAEGRIYIPYELAIEVGGWVFPGHSDSWDPTRVEGAKLISELTEFTDLRSLRQLKVIICE